MILSSATRAQDVPSNLELEDPEDIQLLLEEFPNEGADLGVEDINTTVDTNTPELEGLDDIDIGDDLLKEEANIDDDLKGELEELGFGDDTNKAKSLSDDELDALEEDLGKVGFGLPEEASDELKEIENLEEIEKADQPKITIIDENGDGKDKRIIFEVGRAEKELMEIAKNMQGKIPNSEWNEIAGKSTSGTYKVMPGDWLWKISQKLFGTGFYYAKIWALNPYITNPHEIEPGMILSFSTGSDNMAPTLDLARRNKIISEKTALSKFERFGEDAEPPWIDERAKLQEQGIYFQYSTGDTAKDLDAIGDENLIKEYEVYEPPKLDFAISVPESEYDDQGFDKSAKVQFKYNEGFHLTTFVTTNLVQDFGKVESAIEENLYFTIFNKVYVRFDDQIDVVPGDKFSVYVAEGEVSQKNSDRKGFQYTIAGSFQVVQKQEDLWECEIIETTEGIKRGNRVTVYTPRIQQITKSYNSRIIESVLVGSYNGQSYPYYGDVVYLDRGRADGVEVGNVFQVYGFRDRGTKKNITDNPAYKNGEITVINLTDNFATGIVTQATRDFKIGDIAVTKTKEEAARVTRFKSQFVNKQADRLGDKAVDELDVELNLDDLNDSLLDKADKIQFTEDELAELERQEREKSIITDNERDLRSLERLEGELEAAEKMLTEARLDEDRLLEDQNLNDVEKKFGTDEQESLDELEENFGQRFLDEDLNDKENPYGLTEFDIEEVDELLNNNNAVEEQ